MTAAHRPGRADGPEVRSDDHQRHRALAGASRSRLLAVLRQAGRPMGVRELAGSVGLHPNTAREHLDQLVDAGLVVRQAARPAGRGRPGLRYAAARSQDGEADAYRALADALADELASRQDATEAAISAGLRWGRRTADGLRPPADGREAVRRLVGVLDDLGFAPDHALTADASIRLQRCPFGSLAHERGDIVCNVHLGLMRGALGALGAPLDVASLEPFAEPGACLARLTEVPPRDH